MWLRSKTVKNQSAAGSSRTSSSCLFFQARPAHSRRRQQRKISESCRIFDISDQWKHRLLRVGCRWWHDSKTPSLQSFQTPISTPSRCQNPVQTCPFFRQLGAASSLQTTTLPHLRYYFPCSRSSPPFASEAPGHALEYSAGLCSCSHLLLLLSFRQCCLR